MRKNLILGLVFIAVTMINTSCENFFGNAGMESTPTITYARPIVNKTDTIGFWYNKNKERTYHDTICLGDTVQFGWVFNAYYNTLLRIDIEHEQEHGKILFAPIDSLDRYFSGESDYEKGEFIPREEYSALGFPFKYVPFTLGDDGEIKITIESDADIDGNIQSVRFSIPVVEKKEDEEKEVE